jgi:MFS family permease
MCPGQGNPDVFQIVAGTAALAGLLFGFDTGVISGAILFIKGASGLTPLAEEVLVSAALVGAVCGSTLSGRFTDVLGRKRAILITAAIFTVGFNSLRRFRKYTGINRGTLGGRHRHRCGFLYCPSLHQ